ncbi:MAG: hypothetical protein UV58_C0010G0004 [Candidatus Wolfebacteria bacterium GW2011_GWC1_43_10]|uniref:Outer membrane protein beta-barrel domain-containing protein n=1 Tax=Candidatus Wolfebacteria bacterium GW2011_GWC1_43_10 TaxID=1619011 RepID=A0A0G1CAC1_9BACT|nr:MAG: hypothetical protein UV58_C0010G0004 [Candidatus Wolfebacteria bacterium GW2011_GWC1_43_10]KKT22030.1 MAG: hypothetical protein UW08_C0020G0016 [Parcubacteria group bacterium GW2011_GWB1_43_8b]
MRVRNFTPLVLVALFAIAPANAQDVHVGLAYAPANTTGFGSGIRLDLRAIKTWHPVEIEAGAWISNQAKYPDGATGHRWEWDASLRAVLFDSLRLGIRFDQLGYRTDIPHGATWIKRSDIVSWYEIGFAVEDGGRILLGHSNDEWRIDLRLPISDKWYFFATHEWAGEKKDSALGLALKL